MREIKFRGWYCREDGKKPLTEMLFDVRPGDCLKWKNEGQPITVMQYTGLNDSKDVEIYEGDILSYPAPFNHQKGLVLWFPKLARLEIDLWEDLFSICKDIEVIGNIYQNPELITTGKD